MHSNQSQALATSSHASQWPVSPTCQMRKLSPAQTAPPPGSLLRTRLPHPSHLLGPRRAGPCTHSHPPRPTLGAARHRSLRQGDTFPLLQRISETLITDRAQDARKEWLRQPRPWMAPAQLPPAALSPKCPERPLRPPPTRAHCPTHKAIAHDAAEPLEGVAVSVGEVELRQLGVAEQGAQGGLGATRGQLGHCGGGVL